MVDPHRCGAARVRQTTEAGGLLVVVLIKSHDERWWMAPDCDDGLGHSRAFRAIVILARSSLVRYGGEGDTYFTLYRVMQRTT